MSCINFYKNFFDSYKKLLRYLVVFFVVGVLACVLFVGYQSTVPNKDDQILVTIPEGTSLTRTAHILEDAGVIRSAFIFKISAQLRKISVKAGTYAFFDERTLGAIIDRLHTADYGDVYTSVTFPEGITLVEMADILEAKAFEHFNRAEFLDLSNGKEGYLFPDTYSFLPDTNTQDIVEILIDNFNQRTDELEKELPPTRSWNDIIIMASLIEKESSPDPEEQKIVAGILWKRIDRGIPLQVDAPFVYAIGKGSSDLRTSDLRTDGPYNTYTRKGLPPTRIGNPGISAIEAALHPIESLYFFYLHDTNGGIHYGVTHDDHVRNKQRYL